MTFEVYFVYFYLFSTFFLLIHQIDDDDISSIKLLQTNFDSALLDWGVFGNNVMVL
jgi:hypothetical protein